MRGLVPLALRQEQRKKEQAAADAAKRQQEKKEEQYLSLHVPPMYCGLFLRVKLEGKRCNGSAGVC